MNKFPVLILLAALLYSVAEMPGIATGKAEEKFAVVKGTIYRVDKDHPAAEARITLLDEKKSGGKDNSVEAETDSHGNFVFEKVAEGKYTVSIRTWHKTQKDVPCQFLAAKTKDKNSSLVVMQDKDKFVEQIFIKDFSIKAGKENVKEFDIACQSLFAK